MTTNSRLKHGYKVVFRIVLFFLLLLAGYIGIAVVGALIPINSDFTSPSEGVTIYVTTNGFHTGLVIPVQHRRDKCFQVLNSSNFAQKYGEYRYIGFGWGDRDFYMASYNSGFPSAITVLDALFQPSETLMHVDFYTNSLRTDESVKAIVISQEQYEKLVDQVDASFHKQDEQYQWLAQAGYGPDDYFFKAKGKYHLFNTCNVWTGSVLRKAGIKTSLWTPLESSVFFHLP
jgi:uncharacterized protein (TIGR02117 family)